MAGAAEGAHASGSQPCLFPQQPLPLTAPTDPSIASPSAQQRCQPEAGHTPHPFLPPLPCSFFLPLQDVQLVFQMEIRGKYIVPFTSPKAKVIARVLHDRYLRSTALADINVGALGTFTVRGGGEGGGRGGRSAEAEARLWGW